MQEAARGVFGRLAASILRNRITSVVLLLAFVAFVSSGVAFLQLDFSAKAFFGTGDPEQAFLAEHVERWGNDDQLVLIVDGGGQTLLTAPRLSAIDQLIEELDEIPVVSAATGVTSIPEMSFDLLRPPLPVALLDTLPEDAEAIGDWQRERLDDPALVPSFLSPDGHWAAILVALEGNTDDLVAVSELLAPVRDVMEDFQGQEGLQLQLAGIPAMRVAIADAIASDQLLMVPLSASLVALVLWAVFRTPHGVLVPGVASLVPLAMLLGFMGWVGRPMGLLSQVFLVLVPTIAVADAIHLVSRYHEESARRLARGEPHTDETRRSAIVASMRHMGVACFLTSFTTIIGFLSLIATDMPVLRGFGVFAAAGIAFAYFTMLFIVPLALSATRKGARGRGPSDGSLDARVLIGSAEIAKRRPLLVLGLTGVVVCIALFGATQVQVDSVVTEMMSEGSGATTANQLVDQHLGGVIGFEIDLEAPEARLRERPVLEALIDAEAKLKEDPLVRSVASPSSLFLTMTDRITGQRALPADGISGVWAMADQLGASSALVGPERSRIVVRTTDPGGKQFIEAVERLGSVVDTALAPVGIPTRVTGTTYVSYRGVQSVSRDLLTSLLLAFGVIALIIAMLFRSLRLGILSLVPNIIPLLIAYGAMGLLEWQLDSAPAVAFTIALGLSVDATIHVLARFSEEHRVGGRPPGEAIRLSVLRSGRAIAITTILLAVGFSIQGLSSFPGNALFGALGTLIVFGALVANLFVLPALLRLAYPERSAS